MSNVGQRERLTQDRVVKFFREELDYDYLGDWQDREGNRILKQCIFVAGHRAAALGEGKKLYDQIMDGCGNAMLCVSSMQGLGHAQ